MAREPSTAVRVPRQHLPLADRRGRHEKLIVDAGLEAEIELDSAGTGAWHVGNPPDERASATALAHGIRCRDTRGR